MKLTYFTRPGKTSSFRQEGVPVRALAGAMLVLLLVAGGARAQQAAPADSLATAPADTLATAPADTLAAAAADSAAAQALYRKMEQELAFNPRSRMGV